jgi:hypothetical protein
VWQSHGEASSKGATPPNAKHGPMWPRDREEWGPSHAYLRRWLGADRIEALHTRNRSEADAKAFVAPLDSATGVYLIPYETVNSLLTPLTCRV